VNGEDFGDDKEEKENTNGCDDNGKKEELVV
jgi:hypothetical protein